jgi:hypothetical protein
MRNLTSLIYGITCLKNVPVNLLSASSRFWGTPPASKKWHKDSDRVEPREGDPSLSCSLSCSSSILESATRKGTRKARTSTSTITSTIEELRRSPGFQPPGSDIRLLCRSSLSDSRSFSRLRGGNRGFRFSRFSLMDLGLSIRGPFFQASSKGTGLRE